MRRERTPTYYEYRMGSVADYWFVCKWNDALEIVQIVSCWAQFRLRFFSVYVHARYSNINSFYKIELNARVHHTSGGFFFLCCDCVVESSIVCGLSVLCKDMYITFKAPDVQCLDRRAATMHTKRWTHSQFQMRAIKEANRYTGEYMAADNNYTDSLPISLDSVEFS